MRSLQLEYADVARGLVWYDLPIGNCLWAALQKRGIEPLPAAKLGKRYGTAVPDWLVPILDRGQRRPAQEVAAVAATFAQALAGPDSVTYRAAMAVGGFEAVLQMLSERLGQKRWLFQK